MQTPSATQFEVLPDVVIRVDHDGWIVDITPAVEVDGSVDVTLPSTSVLLPGLIDTHIHAPQWPQLGVGLDLSLEQWLFEYTFPLEARYVDVDFAQAVWAHMVPTLLAHGTTTAVFYSSTHVDATTALARTCADVGLRALVGRVAMDHPVGTPDWYRDKSASDGIEASVRSIEEIVDLDSPLVEAIVTPRFIPACTDDLLRGLAEVAASTSVRIQTHCSESDWEHGHVHERYAMSDTRALESLGLVRPATTLAHCAHVSGDDLALIRDAQAGVAHCPLSNAYFAQAVFPLRRALDVGVRVGLGSDVAGGAEPGLLKQCGHAVTASVARPSSCRIGS
jgi:guanine deaminase